MKDKDNINEHDAVNYLRFEVEDIWEPTESEKRFFERRREAGLGVGLDKMGNLVYGQNTKNTEKEKQS